MSGMLPKNGSTVFYNTPTEQNQAEDGNRHFYKAIRERSGKVLHVVINPNVQPNRVITLFFDRRASER